MGDAVQRLAGMRRDRTSLAERNVRNRRQAIPRTSPATGSDRDPASVVGRHVDVTGARLWGGIGEFVLVRRAPTRRGSGWAGVAVVVGQAGWRPHCE